MHSFVAKKPDGCSPVGPCGYIATSVNEDTPERRRKSQASSHHLRGDSFALLIEEPFVGFPPPSNQHGWPFL